MFFFTVEAEKTIGAGYQTYIQSASVSDDAIYFADVFVSSIDGC